MESLLVNRNITLLQLTLISLLQVRLQMFFLTLHFQPFQLLQFLPLISSSQPYQINYQLNMPPKKQDKGQEISGSFGPKTQGYNQPNQNWRPKGQQRQPAPGYGQMPFQHNNFIYENLISQDSLFQQQTVLGIISMLGSQIQPPQMPIQNINSHEEQKSGPANSNSVSSFYAQSNVCMTHFPEPIMMKNQYNQPMCRKCLSQIPQNQNSNLHKELAQALGIQSGSQELYGTELQLAKKTINSIEYMKGVFDENEQLLQQREKQAEKVMTSVPKRMKELFDQMLQLVDLQEADFQDQVQQTVEKQQIKIKSDINKRLPSFTSMIEKKYKIFMQQVQQANVLPIDQNIKFFEDQLKVFTELDADFEVQLNEFDQISKLHRLLEKDTNEIRSLFEALVYQNLGVDFNIKDSFTPLTQQKIHSFQWNQRQTYIYLVKSEEHFKKNVQMEIETPLYSRAIATDSGQIYLIGGFIRQTGQYLNNAWKYDSMFNTMEPVAQSIYAHADHGICFNSGNIYVAGSFIQNRAHPFCEKYDVQKNKWKVIASMNYPRSGSALCTFKDKYLFSIGGRVDQNTIVDDIEVYDIVRDSWLNITSQLTERTQWIASYMCNAYQITENQVMIFGGKSQITGQVFSGVFLLDMEKLSIVEKGSMTNPCSFMNVPLVFNQILYAYGNDHLIHMYNIPTQKWTCISTKGGY